MKKRILIYLLAAVTVLPMTVTKAETIQADYVFADSAEQDSSVDTGEFYDAEMETEKDSEAVKDPETETDSETEPETPTGTDSGVASGEEESVFEAEEINSADLAAGDSADSPGLEENITDCTGDTEEIAIAEDVTGAEMVGSGDYTDNSTGFTYTVSGVPAEATITGYKGNLSNVVIPSAVNGYKVTRIASSAFENSSMTSLTIPETITVIENYAFYNCARLSNIRFNAVNCADCGYYGKVFYNAGAAASSLTVTFGSGVKRIPGNLFFVYGTTDYYARVASVKMTNSIKEIGKCAFADCFVLQNITWSTGTETIGESAFENCEKLTAAVIPAATKEIGNSAFYNCPNLSSIQFNALNCADCGYYGKVFYNAGAFAGSLSVTFGTGVKRIPGYLFFVYGTTDYYARVSAVRMSDTIKEIGKAAFAGCTELQKVTWSMGTESIGESAFENCEKLSSAVIPAATKEIGNCAFYNCASLSSLQFNASNCADCGYFGKVFYNAGASAGGLVVTFGSGVKRIPAYLFFAYGAGYNYGDSYCAHVKSVKLSDSIQEIGASAFSGCYFLSGITWGNGITSIGEEAFCQCINLPSAYIPLSVKKIGAGAFYDCQELKTVTFNAKSCADCGYYSRVFWNAGAEASGLTVTVGSGVKRIPAYLFYNNENYNYGDGYYAHITSVTLPSGLQQIGYYSFANCYDLKTVTVNGKSTAFDGSAFDNCRSGLTFKCISGSTAADFALKKGFRRSYISSAVSVKAPKITSLKNSKSRKVTVKWNKISNVSGYQVQYSRNKYFSSGVKTKAVSKNSTVLMTLSKLTKKSTYYVRIRAYKKSGGKTYYSSWSSTKKVVVKK